MAIPVLLTPGKIAAEIGTPLHRILHVLRTRPHIQPIARAGVVRVYDRNALEAVRKEINRIAAERLLKGVSE